MNKNKEINTVKDTLVNLNVSENAHTDTQTKTQSILTLSTDPRTLEEDSIQKMIGKAMSVMLSRQVWRVQGD